VVWFFGLQAADFGLAKHQHFLIQRFDRYRAHIDD